MSINRVMAEKMFELFNALSYMIDKKKLKLYCLNRKKNPSNYCFMRKNRYRNVYYMILF